MQFDFLYSSCIFFTQFCSAKILLYLCRTELKDLTPDSVLLPLGANFGWLLPTQEQLVFHTFQLRLRFVLLFASNMVT